MIKLISIIFASKPGQPTAKPKAKQKARMNATEVMNFINNYRNNYNNYNTLPKTYDYFNEKIKDIFEVLAENEELNSLEEKWDCIKWNYLEWDEGDYQYEDIWLKSFEEALARIQL
jgi:hypothetical protein